MTRRKWVIVVVVLCLMTALAPPGVAAGEAADPGESGALFVRGFLLLEQLDRGLSPEVEVQTLIATLNLPEDLRYHVIALGLSEADDAPPAHEFLSAVAAKLEIAGRDASLRLLVWDVLGDCFGVLAAQSSECALARISEAPRWPPAWVAVGDLAVPHLRRFVKDTRLSSVFRLEAARLLGAEGIPGGAADFFKLERRENPPSEHKVFGVDGNDWEEWPESGKTVWVAGFLAGTWAREQLDGKLGGMGHRVGTYVLELNVFYSKPANREMGLVEAMFRAKDALRAR